jgi:hypothetical protein
MSRLISISDGKKRDAHVAFESPRRQSGPRMVGPSGVPARLERLIRATEETSHDALLRRFGTPEAVAKALVDGDPEIPMNVVGRKLGDATRVYLREDGTMLSAFRVLQVIRGPDGAERSRQDFLDVEATVAEDLAPLPWSGKLLPIADTVRKLAFSRKVQIRHVSGLTYEFLYEMAKALAEADKLLVIGAGPKGAQPLIFTTNGAPYRGFLEGRVDGDAYKLVLHLSNLELKSVGKQS